MRVHTVMPGFVETEGFPNVTTLKNAFLRRAVIRPEQVADHIATVLRRDRRVDVRPVLVPRCRGRGGRDAEHRRAARFGQRVSVRQPVGLHFRRATGLTTHEFIALAGLRSSLRVFHAQDRADGPALRADPAAPSPAADDQGRARRERAVDRAPSSRERLQLAQSTVTELVGARRTRD